MKINFSVNSKSYSVESSDYPPEITLNSFLRTYIGLTGTKFMCNEGGCGCCTVSAKVFDPYSKFSQIFSINSCLKLLNTCDGLEITTIEGIGNKYKGYNPIQETLARSNGTQCGYCSPGFVMTMYSLIQEKSNTLTANNIEKSFDGNICRCTGYRPILDAMKSFATEQIVDIEDLTKACKKFSSTKQLKNDDVKDEFELLDLNVNENCDLSPHGACKNSLDCNYNYIKWFRPSTLIELFQIFDTIAANSKYYLIRGGTGHGVYRRPDNIEILIDLNKISDLFVREIHIDGIYIGANICITNVLDLLLKASTQNGFEYLTDVHKHWNLVANTHVRNVAGLAGNLMLKHDHNKFPSDIFIVLEAIDARIEVMEDCKTVTCNSSLEFLQKDMKKKLITKITLPRYSIDDHIFKSYKIMSRSQNAVALLNAAFLLQVKKTLTEFVVLNARLCFGNISKNFVHATQTEAFIANKNLLAPNVVQQILIKLYEEIYLDEGYNHVSQQYRRTLACGILYKFFLSIIPLNYIAQPYVSGKDILERELSYGSQTFSTPPDKYPVGMPIAKLEAKIQCSGEAFFSNDVTTMHNELWAAYVRATHVGSIFVNIDPTEALKLPGIVAFFSAKDIPGKNSFALVGEYPFFVEEEVVFLELNSVVQFYDQPVGVLVGCDRYELYKSIRKVELMYETKHSTHLSTVLSLNHFESIGCPTERIVSSITKQTVSSHKSTNISTTKTIRNNLSLSGQYHFTMEPQTVISVPKENGLTLYSATQFIDCHLNVLEKFLNLPQKNIYIKTVRLGGGYGAKFSRVGQVGCAAALATLKLNRPVRFILSIEEMMRTIGKRPPLNCLYTVVANSTDGRIEDFSIEFYTDLGCNANESAMKLYTITSISNCYKQYKNWNIKGNEVTTDAASNTWCRAPGSFEGITMIETIMDNIAFEIGLDPVDVRLANIAADNKMKILLPKFVQSVDYKNRKIAIADFNKENRWIKKGIAITVMEYGLIFFYPLNVYMVIYHGDGTVNITHGGIEMGQGINTKVIQVAAYTLGIPMENISFRPTNSFVTANSGFTAGSYASETVCKAVQKACETINSRLKPIRDSITDPKAQWKDIIQKAHAQYVPLHVIASASAADLQPYSVFGLACSEVQVDMLTGNIQVKRVDITEDTGESLSPLIDIGQIEGAFIMGLGLWLTEKLIYDRSTGEILTDRTLNYKVPMATDIPISFNINLIQNNPNPVGFLRSKTTGEPAVCLAISALFAVRNALDSARKDSGINEWCALGAPTTPEEVLLNSGTNVQQFILKP